MNSLHGSVKRPASFALLAWAMILNAVMTIAIILLVTKIGYEGFKGGEMGFMVGIFGIVGVIAAIPLLILFLFLVRGLFRMQKWSVVVSLILTIISLLFSPVALTAGIIAVFIALGYTVIILLLEIRCLRYLSVKDHT